jgi:hypothetical protein
MPVAMRVIQLFPKQVVQRQHQESQSKIAAYGKGSSIAVREAAS